MEKFHQNLSQIRSSPYSIRLIMKGLDQGAEEAVAVVWNVAYQSIAFITNPPEQLLLLIWWIDEQLMRRSKTALSLLHPTMHAKCWSHFKKSSFVIHPLFATKPAVPGGALWVMWFLKFTLGKTRQGGTWFPRALMKESIVTASPRSCHTSCAICLAPASATTFWYFCDVTNLYFMAMWRQAHLY